LSCGGSDRRQRAKLAAVSLQDDYVAGTISYMAPEQLDNGRVDVRTDLYSLCLVIYRALTGRLAFDAKTYREAVQSRIAPPDPRSYVDIPADLELVLRIGLARDSKDRFVSAVDLRTSFDAACAGQLSQRYRDRGTALLAADPWRGD
jgi:eukaryotic-like serine/threonine-protein kinase